MRGANESGENMKAEMWDVRGSRAISIVAAFRTE